MKREILTFLMTVSAVLVLSPHLSGSVITHTVTYDLSKLKLDTASLGGVTYTTVDYDGLYNSGEPGTPWLPADHIIFSVPYNATDFSVTATIGTHDSQNLDYPVYPRQASLGGTVTLPDNNIYNSGNPYPSVTACVIDEGMMAGENHVVTVMVMPLKFNTVVNNGGNVYTLDLARSVSLTLSYNVSNTPNVYPMIRKGASLREKGRELTRNMVVNPKDVAGNAVPSSQQNQFNFFPEPLDSVENPDTYMIIATEASLRPLRRLAALKMQEGYRVKIVKVNDAVNDPIALPGDSCYQGADQLLSFCDDAGKLRQYLRKHYLTRGLEYVLLAGTGVPYRTRAGGYVDMYFAEYNTDWRYYTTREFATYVGRLLGTTSDQFDNYTNKLLRYELNPGNGDYTYLTRGLTVESGIYQSLAASFWADNFSVTMFTDNDEQPMEFTGSDIINDINENLYGIINTFNNGFQSGVKIYESKDEYDNYTIHYLWANDSVKVAPEVVDNETGNGLNLLDNKNYPMIYLSPMETTIPYVSNSIYGTGPNYGESFTMGKDYGGPAYFGSTGGITHWQWYDAFIFGNELLRNLTNNQPMAGKALMLSKDSFYPYYPVYEEEAIIGENLLGDPVLDIWTDLPQEYSGITVSRTDNTVTINGITVPGTIISYHSNDGNTGQCEVSTSNVTLTDVSPNSTIMLNKHNFIPYIAPLVLQNTDLEQSQYVFATDVTAGRAVDSGRTNGGVTVKNGAEYEIEASGEVTLAGGFKVELGARFAVKRTTYK